MGGLTFGGDGGGIKIWWGESTWGGGGGGFLGGGRMSRFSAVGGTPPHSLPVGKTLMKV